MEAFLVKVDRGLVPLHGCEYSSSDISVLRRHYLENRPIDTSTVLVLRQLHGQIKDVGALTFS
jgi:hypothetical protein